MECFHEIYFTLGKNLQLAPSFAWHILDEENSKQLLDIKFSHPLPAKGTRLAGTTFFRRFSEVTDRYFSYDYWYKLEPGVEWKDLAPAGLRRRKIALPASIHGSFNILSQESDRIIFGGLQAKLHPALRMGGAGNAGLLLNLYINTELYFVYYAGLRFSRKF